MHGRTAAIAVLVLFSGLGCQAGSQSGPAAKQAEPTAVIQPSGITTVAMLALVNSSGVERATPLISEDLESRIKAQGGYNYIGFDETAARAKAPEARADLDRLRKDWSTARRFDPTILSRFAGTIGAQGVLAADLLTWTSEKLEWNVEGRSWSRVTCKLDFIDAKNGKTIWSKTEDSLLESAYYDPSQTAMGDQSGVPATEVVNRAPDPPDVEEAARQAAQKLAEELPKPKSAS